MAFTYLFNTTTPCHRSNYELQIDEETDRYREFKQSAQDHNW